ncbi:MAG: hypothetical protein AAB415_03160 [Patescibacteria group bacterium]
MEPNKDTKETPEQLFERKREEARQAMEGPERTERREQSEREKQNSSERGLLEEKLTNLRTQKEKLELDWIALDDERQIIREALTPILEQEKVTEAEEARLELEEIKTVAPEAKQGIEKERWATQDKRRESEQKKWGFQDKLFKVEQAIDNNTQKYRLLLDEEEVAQTKLNALKALGGDA